MKRLCLSFCILHSAFCILAATPVVFTNAHFTGTDNNSRITIAPHVKTAQRANGRFVSGLPITLSPVAGIARTNLVAGDYDLSFAGMTGTVLLSVPDSTNEQAALDLVHNLPTYTFTNLPLQTVAAGTNVQFTTNAGALVISVTNSGGANVAAGTNVITVTNGSTVTVSAVVGRTDVTNAALAVAQAVVSTNVPAGVITNESPNVTLRGTFSGDGDGLTAAAGWAYDEGTNFTFNLIGRGTSTPQEHLHVIGNIKASGTNFAGYFSGDGSGLTSLPARFITNTQSDITLTGTFGGNGAGLTNISVTTDPSGFYVDNELGDDAATGRSGDPLRSIAKAVIMATNQPPHIYLRRNRIFRESLHVPDNATVRAYGDGSRPIVSGAALLTNSLFTLATGWTNTYQYAINPPPETNTYISGVSSNVLKVWDNSVRLKGGFGAETNSWFIGVARVESVNGSYWYDNTNRILYLHLSDNSNPNNISRTLEASVRTLAIWGGTNILVEDLIGEKSYVTGLTGNQGYGLMNHDYGTFRRCVGRHSWNHAVGALGNSVNPVGTQTVFDTVEAYDCEWQTDNYPTLFVASKDTGGTLYTNLVIFTNCLAVQPVRDVNHQSKGFLAHGPSILAMLDNCTSLNNYSGFQIDKCLTSRGFFNWSSNSYIGAEVYGHGVSNLVVAGANYGLMVNTTNAHFRDITSFGCLSGISLNIPGTTTNHFDNLHLMSNSYAIFSYGGEYLTVSNSTFKDVGYCYMTTGGQNPLIAAGGNNYNNVVRYGSDWLSPPYSWTTFSAWTNSWVARALDRNSTTNSSLPLALNLRGPSVQETAGLILRGSNIVEWAQLSDGWRNYGATNWTPNRVGIGTNNPQAALQVAGATLFPFGAISLTNYGLLIATQSVYTLVSNVSFSQVNDFYVGSDGSLSNRFAGFYGLINTSSLEGTGGAGDVFEQGVFTNNVECVPCEWVRKTSSTDTGAASSTWVVYLPAMSRIDCRIQNTGGTGVVVYKRNTLRIGCP